MKINLTHNEEESDNQSPAGKVASVFSRIFLIIWSLGFMGIPLFGLIHFIGPKALQYVDSLGWKDTPCVIERSVVTEDTKEDLYWADISYSYTFQDKSYTAKKIESGKGRISNKTSSNVRPVVESYPVGMRTVCYVNPDVPKQACLARSFPWGLLGGAAFVSVFIVVGGAVLLSGLGVFRKMRKRRRARQDHASDNPFTNVPVRDSDRKPVAKKDYSRWFLTLFGMVFAGVGGLALSSGISDMAAAKSSNAWVETPCVIERSKVKSHDSDDGTTYSILVRYTYEWEGKSFSGERYDFSSGSDSEYSNKANAVKRYPAGAKAVCYVNPANPDQAVLERSTGDSLWILLVVGGVFSVVGIGIMCAGLFYGKKSPDTRTLRVPTLLSVSMNPRREFLGLSFAAVFWNGIVSVFVSVIIRTYLEDGTVEWFLAAFISIFVIVGIFIIFCAIRAFFSMFGPRLTLFMTPGIYAGETVSLDWALQGDAYRIRALDMTLECVMRRSEGSGKRRSTREDVLRRIELLSEKGTLAASRGKVTFTVPEGAEISSTGYEGIFWRIKADIKQNMKPTQKWVFKLSVLDKLSVRN